MDILIDFLPLFAPCSPEDQSQGDLLHQRRHQDRAGDQEQDHLQAERRDGARPEEDCAVAQGRPAVHLRGDERHQRPLLGHGPEAGRKPGHHLAAALAEGTERVQEDFPKHPQAAVLGGSWRIAVSSCFYKRHRSLSCVISVTSRDWLNGNCLLMCKEQTRPSGASYLSLCREVI